MTFRADEAARIGYEQAEGYLVPRPRDADESLRARGKETLQEIVNQLGPVVDAYPTWHPLVCNHNTRDPVTLPSDSCGYQGLDHSVYFASGFVTCPYGDGQRILDSVGKLPNHPRAHITAEKLDVKLYHPDATPILIRCNWDMPRLADGTIPLSIAMALIIENELPCWRWSKVAETWETMRPYFLGRPHGSRSSLFVNQETGQGIKKAWKALINTGMFGPIRV